MVRGRNTRVIGVRIQDELYQQIEDEADLLHFLSVSDWLRKAIDEKLARAQEIRSQVQTKIKRESENRLVENKKEIASAQANSGPAATSDQGSEGNKFPGTPRGVPCPCGSGEKYKRCCGVAAPSAKKRRK